MGVKTAARSCATKDKHKSLDAAEAHRERLIRGGAAESRLEIYRCRHCRYLHVGHAMPPTGRRRRGHTRPVRR